jgi:branched-chain amino acid aminotransferase
MAPSKFELYGYGVFTTIAVVGGEPFRWESHWHRLTTNAAAIGINLSQHSESHTRNALSEAIVSRGIDDGRARITFSDQRQSPLWMDIPPVYETALNILVGERRTVSQFLRLGTSPYTVNTRSPLVGVKSCNYLEPICTIAEAKTRGFDEGVRVNENGHITSAAMANLFWLNCGELFTPSVSTGCLAGTTREYILENLDCREVEAAIVEIEAADAIFLTSAGLGVVEVDEFGSRQLEPSDHPIKTILPWAN